MLGEAGALGVAKLSLSPLLGDCDQLHRPKRSQSLSAAVTPVSEMVFGCLVSAIWVPQKMRWGGKMVRVKITGPAILSLRSQFAPPAFLSFGVPQVIVFKASFPVWSLIYKAVAGVQSDA